MIKNTISAECVKLYNSGNSIKEISKILDIANCTVYRILKRHNVKKNNTLAKVYKKVFGKKFNHITFVRPSNDDEICNIIPTYKNYQKPWLLRCDCGNEFHSFNASSYYSGAVKTCGCLVGKKYFIGSARSVWRTNYNKENDTITFDAFLEVSQKNCLYCGKKPENVYNRYSYENSNSSERAKHAGDFIYNGLDRIDNSKYYSDDNVVPCCQRCNWAKSDMTIDEFKKHLSKLIGYNFTTEGVVL